MLPHPLPRPFPLLILAVGFLLVAGRPAWSDLHIPTTPPNIKIEAMDVYWKRPDAKYIRLTFKLWNEDKENIDGVAVRLFVRADSREAWRPIKTWLEQKVPGHDALVLEYQPGAITDPVLYLGHFDMRLDVFYRSNKLDSKEQRYQYQ